MTERLIYFGPVTNCLDRSVFGALAGRDSHACDHCGGYHDANARPLIGPCAEPECRYQSLPGGSDHPGIHSYQEAF